MLRHLKLKMEMMLFHIDDEKLLENYKSIWVKFEDSKNIELSTLPVYDDRYIKIKIRKYGDDDVPEDDIECEFFTVISIDSLRVYKKKCCLQIANIITALLTNKHLADYLNDILIED